MIKQILIFKRGFCFILVVEKLENTEKYEDENNNYAQFCKLEVQDEVFAGLVPSRSLKESVPCLSPCFW